MSLRGMVLSKLCTSVIFVLVLFFPAGTFRYWQGWAFVSVWFVAAGLALLYLRRHSPTLVTRRLNTREPVHEQKILMRANYAILFLGFFVAGLDFRFGWTHQLMGGLPAWLIVTSLAIILAGRLVTYWVMSVNQYASRTVCVETGQQLITRGPYKRIRHPMYFGMLLIMFFTPVALGSYLALPVFALTIPILILRLLNEERLLRRDLKGYAEYCVSTPYRLVPYAW
jgi:protein-S-isoprenylcysteine O-methyltransferase Ste14